MRHPIRSAVVAGTSALLLAAGAGTASAQGSLQFALPFPLDIPGLASLAAAPAAPDDTADEGQADPLVVVPDEINQKAFEGTVVAGVNEARTAVGADRLVASPELEASAGERAELLAAGDPTTGDLTVPDAVSTGDRSTLELPAKATPPNVLTELLADTGMRDRMLDGDTEQVGVGMAADDEGEVHVVLDFA